ncbi:hypothetical protein BDZ91DRAFT_714486 [Kalaharituber pfeilii]|nr:hypothetical protein BDZ91DRAFT_714486 [Kalaharituber pfeilii]
MKSHQILMISIEIPLLLSCLLRTSNSEQPSKQQLFVCSFRVCCCRHLQC